MSTLWQRANEAPVTSVIAIVYVTAFALGMRADPDTVALLERGVMVAALVADGEPWRLLSHAFLHGGIVHLGFNLLALTWLGPAVERSLGSLRFLLLYVVAAVGGAVAVTLTDAPLQPVVGGSGALFGMMGAAVALHMQAGRHLLEFLDYQGPRQLLLLIAVNLAFGLLMPRVSNSAHIGGLLAGFVLTLGGFRSGRWQPQRRLQVGLLVACAGLLVHCLWPVTRLDYELLRWDREPPGARRDALRQTVSLLLIGRQDGITADAALQPEVDQLRRELAGFRGG